MYDGIVIPFECNKCAFKCNDRQKMPKNDLWWTKDTRGVLDTYYPNNVLILKGDREIKDGFIIIYMECPNCNQLIYGRAFVKENKLTGEMDHGEAPQGRYY